MQLVEETAINFRFRPWFYGLVFLFFFSFVPGIVQLVTGRFNLIQTCISVFVFCYALFMSVYMIDEIVLRDSGLAVRVGFRRHVLATVDSMSLTRSKMFGVVIMAARSTGNRTVRGYYVYRKDVHARLIGGLRHRHTTVKLSERLLV